MLDVGGCLRGVAVFNGNLRGDRKSAEARLEERPQTRLVLVGMEGGKGMRSERDQEVARQSCDGIG